MISGQVSVWIVYVFVSDARAFLTFALCLLSPALLYRGSGFSSTASLSLPCTECTCQTDMCHPWLQSALAHDSLSMGLYVAAGSICGRSGQHMRPRSAVVCLILGSWRAGRPETVTLSRLHALTCGSRIQTDDLYLCSGMKCVILGCVELVKHETVRHHGSMCITAEGLLRRKLHMRRSRDRPS